MRTAYTVARLGTVSAAAAELGIHRATVLRHIDSLEASLGARLFQRHARGYTPTDAGLDLARVAKTTSEQMEAFAGRMRGRGAEVSGEIVITSVEVVTPIVVDALARFRAAHPGTSVRHVVSPRVLELAYGEAHVAVRAGRKPDHPDNVVRPYFQLRSTLFAHESYVERCGLPSDEASLADHHFVTAAEPRAARFFGWLESVVPADRIVLRSGNQRVLREAIQMGMGIGFAPCFEARRDRQLHQVLSPREDWEVPFWLVTHVDLHRSAKVRALSEVLRAVAEEEADAGGLTLPQAM